MLAPDRQARGHSPAGRLLAAAICGAGLVVVAGLITAWATDRLALLVDWMPGLAAALVACVPASLALAPRRGDADPGPHEVNVTEVLAAAVTFARHLSEMSDYEAVLDALQTNLRRWWPDAGWLVLSSSHIERAALPAEARLSPAALLRALQVSFDPTAPSSSSTMVARQIDEDAQRTIFTLRDASRIYAVALADRSSLAAQSATQAEIFMRVAIAALRTVTLLESLLTSEKLAAVGRIAAGVAHEINNPLAYVLLNLRALERELEGETLQAAREAADGALRIEQIVQGMRLLSREENVKAERLDLAALALRTAKIARARDLRISVDVQAEGPVWVCVDEIHVGQILLNLITNAVDAVQERAEPEVLVHIFAETGRAVVDVSDNGSGVSTDVQRRLFVADVSTKGRRGFGMGLRISRSLARAHEGEVELRSTGRTGSTFRLELPLAKSHPSCIPPPFLEPGSSSPPRAPEPEARPSVLIIDDESGIVRSLRRLLSPHAQVTGTTDPTHGLQLAQQEDFDLILTDLNMPRLSGTELIEALERSAPDVARRVLIMTGSIDEPLAGREWIPKPIDADKLVARLARGRTASDASAAVAAAPAVGSAR